MAILRTDFRSGIKRGLDDRWDPPAGSASVIENWQWDMRGGWETVGGYYPVLQKAPQGNVSRYTGSDVIQTCYWFCRHNGAQQFLLYEDGENLRVFVGSGGTYWDTIQTGRHNPSTPWQKTQYAAWGNWCYIINGIDGPVRYNGKHLTRCGFSSSPGAPKAYGPENGFLDGGTVTSGLGLGTTGEPVGGSDVTSKYRYAITYVNDLGTESPLSPLSDEVSWTLAAGAAIGARRMVALEIPNGPYGTVAIRIYRTRNYEGEPSGSARTLYFCRELNYNIRDIWIDAIPDAALGGEIDSTMYGAWPNGAKYIAFFKGTCFLAGMPEYPDRVVWSRAGQPENFPIGNFLPFGDMDSGEVTGLRATKNALVVFKRRGIYLIKGDPVNGFFGSTLSEDVGCCAPNSFADLPGRGLFFVSEQGVYLLVGAHEVGEEVTRAVPLFGNGENEGGPLERWKDVNIHNLQGVAGAFYHRAREYWLPVPLMGQRLNNITFIYHYDIGVWSTRTDLPINCLTETRDHRGYLIFGSHDTASHPGVHVWSQGWDGFDEVPVSSTYVTSNITFANAYESMSVQSLFLDCVGYGGDITLDYYINQGVDTERVRSGNSADPRTQQDPSDVYALWNSGTWGDGTLWKSWRKTTIRWDVQYNQEECRSIQFKIVVPASLSKTTPTPRTQLLGYDVQVVRGAARDVYPLNTIINPQVP